MKIMIEIPDELYKASQIVDVKYEDVIQIPLEVIANGTPIDELEREIKPEFLNEQIDKLIDSAYRDGYRDGCNDTLQKVNTDIEDILRNHIIPDNHCNIKEED